MEIEFPATLPFSCYVKGKWSELKGKSEPKKKKKKKGEGKWLEANVLEGIALVE